MGTGVLSFVWRSLGLPAVGEDRSCLPKMPPSVLPPQQEVGAGEAFNCFNCSITQLNIRRNGRFDVYFYKPSHKAFIFSFKRGDE